MAEPLDTDVAIEAPEHIVFRHVIAGPARRSVALLLDLVFCYGASLLISCLVIVAFAGFAGFKGALESALGAGTGIILVVVFAAQWLYAFLWEGFLGRSPGKMILGLRVVMRNGRPIGFGAAALRNVLRAADALPGPYLVGALTMSMTRRFQRLGDLAAGTMVIFAPRPQKATPLVLWPPPQPAELAQMVSLPDVVPLDVDERAAIELFLRRRAALGAAREQELASILVAPLRERFGLELADASRTLALLYDRAMNAGRGEVPRSSRAAAIAARLSA